MTSVTFNCMSKSEGLGSELSCVDGGNVNTSGTAEAEQCGDNEADTVASDEIDGFVSFCCGG